MNTEPQNRYRVDAQDEVAPQVQAPAQSSRLRRIGAGLVGALPLLLTAAAVSGSGLAAYRYGVGFIYGGLGVAVAGAVTEGVLYYYSVRERAGEYARQILNNIGDANGHGLARDIDHEALAPTIRTLEDLTAAYDSHVPENVLDGRGGSRVVPRVNAGGRRGSMGGISVSSSDSDDDFDPISAPTTAWRGDADEGVSSPLRQRKVGKKDSDMKLEDVVSPIGSSVVGPQGSGVQTPKGMARGDD